jgi:hypothetical protein
MNTKRWTAFLPLLLGVLLAAGCYYMPTGSQGSARVSMALTKGLPTNVTSSIALIVSGPGMKTMANEYPKDARSVSLEVPAGLARTFTVLASTPSVTLRGEATADLVAGETKEIVLNSVAIDSQIIVPDYQNRRLVQISDMLGTGWTEKSVAASPIYPYDVDFDSQGRIFVANYGSTSPLFWIDDITIDPQTVNINATFTFLYALAIDRPENLIYFSNGSLLYKKDLGNAADLGSPLSITPPGSIMGLAVDQNGMLYIAAYSGSAVGGSLIKYDPVAGKQITSYAPGSGWDPWDVSVQGGYVYTTHKPISVVYKIAQSDLNLKPIGESTGPAADPFYGPRRFVAILSKRITFTDEMSGADRLVTMNNIDGVGFQTYGSTGTGPGQFLFYSTC